ncbi:unnamed protein product [Symbiodinium sp. KB8]|nr:unnamed protein product [Symbiodinium sp. KB8]
MLMPTPQAANLRSASRSPRRRTWGEDSQCCFAMNARWWQAPGAKADDNPLSDYDRDAILKQNPLSADLIRLNEHVVTCDSQDSQTSEPSAPPETWYEETQKRRPHFSKVLAKHQRRRSATVLLQRAYIEMICRSEEQARRILGSVGNLCYFVLTLPPGRNECSDIFHELSTDALPLTAMIFPDRKVGQPPLYFVLTHLFRGVGAEDVLQPGLLS